MLRSLLLATLLLGPVLARAQQPTDGVVVPPTSVATEESSIATIVNPAALGLAPSSAGWIVSGGDDAVVGGRSDNGLFGRVGGIVAGEDVATALGLAVEWSDPRAGGCTVTAPCVRRTSLALSTGTPFISFGGAARWFKTGDSASLDGAWSGDLALITRPVEFLSIGAVAANLNTPRVNGTDVARKYTLGLAARPYRRYLTVAADATIDEDNLWDTTRLSFLGIVEPIDGLQLLGRVSPARAQAGDWRTTVELGLRFGFGHVAVTGSGFDVPGSNSVDGFTGYLEVSSVRERGLFAPARSAHVVDLGEALEGPSRLAVLLGRRDALDPFVRLSLQLQRLARDESVGVLVLKIRGAGELGLGRIEELRALLGEMRGRGVKVVAWLSGGGDADYYLATAADRIYAAPQTLLEINGFAATRYYLRGLLTKLGVEPEFVKIGAYKSAPEQFTEERSSEAAAEQTNALLDDQFPRYVAAVAKARGLTAAEVQERLDRGLWLSETAVEAKLIDGTSQGTGAALDEVVAQLAGERLPRRGAGPDEERPPLWGHVPALAVVEISGDIVPGEGVPGQRGGADDVIRRLREVAEDASVRAVVLRVDSPGGDVAASEAIYLAVQKLRERKPVVASFGDVAASGGYYAACGADWIVAEPSTLTGSIGVFAGKADLSALYAKVGITSETFRRGDRADFFTTRRPWTEPEKAELGRIVDRFYETFLQRVAAGRKMTRDEVHEVAQGRVWTGAQAKDRRLVDGLGGLEVALAEARSRAKLPADAPVRLIGSTGLFDLPDARGPASPDVLGTVRELLLAADGNGSVLELGALLRASPVVAALVEGRPLALALDLPLVR